jgi:hypothetical protein
MSNNGSWYGRKLERAVIRELERHSRLTIAQLTEQLHQEAPYLHRNHLYRRIYYAVIRLQELGDIVTERVVTENKTTQIVCVCSDRS